MVPNAVIPVGWTGCAPGSAADVPLEFVPVLDVPSIRHVLDEAADTGADQIILLGGPYLDEIEDDLLDGPELGHLRSRCDILVLPYRGAVSVGQAVLCARSELDQAPFAWLQPDVFVDAERPCLAQLSLHYPGATLLAVHAAEAPDADALPLIRTDPGDPHRVADLVMEGAGAGHGGRLVLTGRHILHPDVLEALDAVHPGPGDLVAALRLVARQGAVYCRRFVGAPFSLRTAHGRMCADLALAGRSVAVGVAPAIQGMRV